jgi:hypothetical protein
MRGTVPGGAPGRGGYGASVTADEPDTGRAATLVWAVRLLYAQAAALAVLTGWLGYLDVAGHPGSVAVAAALTVLAAVAAACVALVARALGRRSMAARGPAVVVQLMVIASGGFLLQTGPLWAGLVLMALGVLVGVLIVLPPSTRALGVG